MQGLWQFGRIRGQGLVHLLGYGILLLKVRDERELVYPTKPFSWKSGGILIILHPVTMS